jgi:nucleotide-binding universal stress UspA family protein
MKTLIVPVDFSPASLSAARYAADMAAAIQAELFLLHVIEISVTDSPLRRFELDAFQDNAQKKLIYLRNQLLLHTKDKINIHVTAGKGDLINELRTICKNKNPFAIIMSSGSKSAVERLFVGSHAVSAANNSLYPVLIIPENSSFKEIKKICFACDLKDIYNVPIEPLRELISTFNASVDILYVAKNKEEKLNSAVAASLLELHLKEFHPQIHFIINESIEEGINKFARQYDENIILVIPRKHDFFESLFHKSQSKKLILHTHIPTLAISE